MTIKEILERNGRGVVTVRQETPVEMAVEGMKRWSVTALVVSDDGCGIDGLVCERDLIRALKSHGVGRLMPMTVADIMRRDVPTCRPDEDLRRVMTRMCARRSHHMPVVGEQGLCGMVSLADIVRRRLDEARDAASLIRRSAFAVG